MTNQQLLDYIVGQRSRGVSDTEIRNAMLTVGWKAEDLDGLLLKKTKKNWKRYVLFFGCFLVVLVIFVVIALSFLPNILSILKPGDAELVDDTNLQLSKITVLDEENGFYDLDKITDEIIYEPGDYYQRLLDTVNYNEAPPWDLVFAEDLIANNQEALNLFYQAAEKDHIQMPAYMDPANLGIDSPLYQMGNYRVVARIVAVNAQRLSRADRPDDALREAVKLNKIGHKLINGQNNFIAIFVGIAIQKLGTETIHKILRFGNPSKEVLMEVSETVGISSDNLEGYKNGYGFEYTNIVNTIVSTINAPIEEKMQALSQETSAGKYSDRLGHSYYYKPNQTKNLYANLYLPQVNAVGNVCQLDELERDLSQFQSSLYDDTWKIIFEENAIGKLLFSVTVITLSGSLEQQCLNDFASAAVQTELAIRAYKLDNNILPTSLNELVPLYFGQVPLDPFDHEPIRYSVEKQIIYSVGVGEVDLGGSMGNDWTQMENPTFKMEF